LEKGHIIKTGICSFGMSGKLFHAPFIEAHRGYELSGVVERNLSASRQLYPVSRLYRSVDELCEDPDIELVVVNTPTHLHYEQGKKAIASGKHVIIEKPFTVTVAESVQLAAMAKERGVFLSVYQNRRYDGDYLAVKAVIDKEMLGELREVEIRFDRFRPLFGGKQHKEGNLPGSGVLYDLSPHLVDQAIQLFEWPEAIYADLMQMRDDVEAPDYFELLLYYDKMRVRLKASCIARESTYAYILHGMKGSFLQQRSDLQEQQLLAGTRPTPEPWCISPETPDGILHTEMNGKTWREETRSSPGNYMGYYDDVYRSLTEGAANPVPAEQAILNMKIIEAALESARENRIIFL
jgi:predicted dehydrogenase